MNLEHRIKVLLSCDDTGHTTGYLAVATWLRDAGMEVILGGTQIPREIVEAASQEDVECISYRIMGGDPKTLVSKLFELMKEKGLNLPVIVGGIIPDKQIPELKEMGVIEIFTPGTPFESIVNFYKDFFTITNMDTLYRQV